MINHVISYFSTNAEYLSLNRSLVVSLLAYFNNSKTVYNDLPRLFGRQKKLLPVLSSLFGPCFSTMPPVCREKHVIRLSASGSKAFATSFVPALTIALKISPNNDLFQEFMRIYIEKVGDQTLAGKARDKFDRLFKF